MEDLVPKRHNHLKNYLDSLDPTKITPKQIKDIKSLIERSISFVENTKSEISQAISSGSVIELDNIISSKFNEASFLNLPDLQNMPIKIRLELKEYTVESMLKNWETISKIDSELKTQVDKKANDKNSLTSFSQSYSFAGIYAAALLKKQQGNPATNVIGNW